MAGEENSTVEPAAAADPNAIHLQLDVFEGPLDLLLHLIRAHELDIFDIPISFVTEKYLHYLNMMRELHIDVASEFLVMAATLAHIKSKMLLPRDATDDGDDESEDPLDPRTELVRRLLEYQKYKDAAHGLASRSALGRDVFERGTSEPVPKGPAPLAPGNIFRLFDAFEQVLKRANQTADHKVLFERVSISERIMELTELLHDRSRLPFAQLFEDAKATPKKCPKKEEAILNEKEKYFYIYIYIYTYALSIILFFSFEEEKETTSSK